MTDKSLFDWSSPNRVFDGQQLTPIPLEIFQNIFSYLEPSETFSNTRSTQTFSKLALVCRFFASYALPRVFRRLEIRAHPKKDKGEVQWVHFFRSLIHGKQQMTRQLAPLVEEIRLIEWSPAYRMKEMIIVAFLTGVYLPGMKKLPNLRTLDLVRCEVSKSVNTMIQTLTSLRVLRFRESTLYHDFPVSLPLVTFSNIRSPVNVFPSLSMQTVQRIEGSIEQVRRILDDHCLTLPSLRALEMFNPEGWSMSKLPLEDTLLSRLEELHYNGNAYVADTSPQRRLKEITAQNAPHLRALTCTCTDYFLSVVRQCPLATLSFCTDQTGHPLSLSGLLSDMGASMQTLVVFSLPFHWDHISLGIFQLSLSNLQQLRLVCEFHASSVQGAGGLISPKKFSEFKTMLAPANVPNLKSFQITFDSLPKLGPFTPVPSPNLADIQEFHARHPKVDRLDLGAVLWRWCSQNERWFPAVPIAFHKHVRSHWLEGEEGKSYAAVLGHHPDVLNPWDE
ncbi:hypothetical protein DL96DRAFT_1683378 [Flagelloscypha sp. PMI_526]|nr:hypothetical protein DL96DRAFT_1683378 [Flagelloscypha sp. PMI_526]